MDGENCNSQSLEMSAIVKGISSCLNIIGKAQTCKTVAECENTLKEGRYRLLKLIKQIKDKYCPKPSMSSKEDLEREIFMTNMETEYEENKIFHMRKEWNQQQKQMAKLQECVYKKNRLLSLYGNYCSSQGSALCSLLAMLTDKEFLIKSYLEDSEQYLVQFIKIANGCLFSFVRTYSSDAPLEGSVDYKYVHALFTCILHVSNVAEGRQFLITRSECQTLLEEAVSLLPRLLKHPTLEPLYMAVLKILHNLSGEENGALFLQSSSDLLCTLNSCISLAYEPKYYKCCLEILEKVTNQIQTKTFLNNINEMINMQRLQELTNRKYKDVNQVSRKILRNIEEASKQIAEKGEKVQRRSICSPQKVTRLSRECTVICSSTESSCYTTDAVEESTDYDYSGSSSTCRSLSSRRNRSARSTCRVTKERGQKPSKSFSPRCVCRTYPSTRHDASTAAPKRTSFATNEKLLSDSTARSSRTSCPKKSKGSEKSSRSSCSCKSARSGFAKSKSAYSASTSGRKEVKRSSKRKPAFPVNRRRNRSRNTSSSCSYTKNSPKDRKAHLDAPRLGETNSSYANKCEGSLTSCCCSSISAISTPSTSKAEMCTCGAKSDKCLVPMSPDDRMVASLSERDRRVARRGSNFVRVVSRLRKLPKGQQKIITRVKVAKK